jgi:predicted PhzF superfamily epimerase YddE/YHI9
MERWWRCIIALDKAMQGSVTQSFFEGVGKNVDVHSRVHFQNLGLAEELTTG